MAKKAPIEQLINFEFHDDHITADGHIFFLYRYFPPNISIMTDDEIKEEIAGFARLLDTLRRPFAIFATDKTEDLSNIRLFYENLAPEFDYITTDILSVIEDTEVKSSSVQRAFYFIYQAEDIDGDIYNVFVGHGYHIEKAGKEELSVLMRNYLLREFTMKGIYDITQEIDDDPKLKKIKGKVYNSEIIKRIAPHRIDFGTRYATQNGFLRKTVMIKNFPHEIPATCLQELASIRGTSFTMRLSLMPTGDTRRMVDAQLKNRNIRFSSSRGTQSMDADAETATIREFYQEISRNKNAIYRLNVFIEMYGKDEKELAAVEDEVESCLVTRAITYEKLVYEQKEAFQSVWPLGKDCFVSDCNNMPSTTAAALYPCSYSCRLDNQGMLLGQTVTGGNMFIDLWQRDANVTNSNYTIIGMSGQGKSYLQKKIITLMAIRDIIIWILDPDNEYTHLIRALGGTVYNCSSGEFIINPFHVRSLRTDEDDEQTISELEITVPKGQAMFFQHLSWLHDFFGILLSGLDLTEVKALDILTQELYAEMGIDETTDFSTLKSTDYPTFTDLYAYIEARADADYKMIEKSVMNKLLLHLRDCTVGSLGAIFNGHTNIQNDRLICFSMAELIQGSAERMKAALFNITTYIWSQIGHHRRPSMLNIDELYLYLGEENITMVKYLNFFVKRARKYNALIGIATQQLADCLQPSIVHYTTALFNNAATKFLFYPDKIDLELVKQKLQLSDGEIKCINKSNQRHCLVKAGNDRYYMKVGTLPFEKDLFGSAGGR